MGKEHASAVWDILQYLRGKYHIIALLLGLGVSSTLAYFHYSGIGVEEAGENGE